MLIKFVGPRGPFINENLKKSIQVGEVFDCPVDVLTQARATAPQAFVDPSEAEILAYQKANKKSDSEPLQNESAEPAKKPAKKE
jgi:hypothetical protein